MKQYLQKSLSDQIGKNHILLCLLILLLTLTPLLGLGFKNTILSSTLILSYIIYINPKFNYSKSLVTLILLGFLTVFSLSMLFRQTPYGFHEFMNLSLGSLLAINLLNHKIQTQKLSRFLVFLTGLMSILSIFVIYSTGADRAFGTFFGADPFTFYPNAFSNLLLVSIVLASQVILNIDLKNYKSEKVLFLSFFISLVGFWSTFSRGAYLSLAIAMTLLLGVHLIKTKKNWKASVNKYISLLMTASLALIISISLSNISEYGSNFSDRVQTSDISSIRSATERPVLWEGAVQIFKDNPLTGTGSGSFQFIYPQYQNKLLSNAPHPHNLILKLLSENGIIVTVIFCTLILYCLKPSNFKNNSAYLAAFIGLNLQFLLDYNLNFPTISFIYFFLIANLLSSEDIPSQNKSSYLKLLGFIFTAILTISIITQAFGYYYIKQIENNPDSPGYYINLAKIAPFEHQLYSQVDYPIQTNKFPNFHPYIYVQALNTQDPDQRLPIIKKALEMNYYNDLGYQALHIQTLLELEDSEAIQLIDQEYYQLVSDYIDLLNVNAHNTITSSNPQNAYKLIQFIKPISTINWSELETKLVSVYKTEKNKFQTRFKYNLPNIDE